MRQLAILIGAFSLGMMAPNAQAIMAGLSAASKIIETIDRVSQNRSRIRIRGSQQPWLTSEVSNVL
jgi:hypothetical protein